MKILYRLTVLFLIFGLIIIVISCAPKEKVITVSSKQFTEQVILGKIMKVLLENGGFKVDDKTILGGTLINRKALLNKEVDVYMEYTGTALLVHLKHKRMITDSQKCYQVVKEEDFKKNNLVWLKPCKFNNTYCLMMRKNEAQELNINTISNLADYVRVHPDVISFATDAEFFARPDGYSALEKEYRFKFPKDKIIKMDPGLTYKALKTKKVDIAMGFATDGRISAFGFVVLEDDKKFFPVYNPAPVVRKEVLKRYPQIEDILNKIGPLLDTETIRKLNYKVDVKHRKPEKVAKDWLIKVGLIKK